MLEISNFLFTLRLLYITSKPEVNERFGHCDLDSRYINPKNFVSFFFNLVYFGLNVVINRFRFMTIIKETDPEEAIKNLLSIVTLTSTILSNYPAIQGPNVSNFIVFSIWDQIQLRFVYIYCFFNFVINFCLIFFSLLQSRLDCGTLHF